MNRKKFYVYGVLLIFAAFLIACQSSTKDNQQTTQQATAQLAPEARLAKLKEILKEIKQDLNKQGEYDCCIQPPCNWCALQEGECDCRDNLKEGKAVCPGCGLGWHNGKGVVEGVTADQVKWDITHEHHEEGHEH